MGGLFSTFGMNSLPNIYIDLESVTAKDQQERDIIDSFLHNVLEPANQVLEKFSQYRDGQVQATLAMTTPTQENKEIAWNTILPNIHVQMEVYSFAKVISSEFLRLTRTVLDLMTESSIDLLTNFPAVTRCFADCFDIFIQLDTQVIMLPKLLNDLAFFRRNSASRNVDGTLDSLIENSNLSTVFWAVPMPFLSDGINALRTAYGRSPDQLTKLLTLLGGVSDICTAIATQEGEMNDRLIVLCLRCIVGSVIMYDNLCPTGAFCGAKFHVREAMEFVCSYEPKQTGLINFIKYCSKHLNDPISDPKIKILFDS